MSLNRGNLYGIGVETDLDLPLLPERVQPAVQIRRAQLTPVPLKPFCSDDNIRVFREPSGHFLITAGAVTFSLRREAIFIDSDDDSHMDLLVFYVFPYFLSLLGRECLHGCVVERDGHGLGVLGAPGSGKSTTALRLADMGFRLLADDLVVFDQNFRALPGPPFIRLRPDQAPGREGEWDGGGKFRYRPPHATRPVSLRKIIIMDGSFTRLASVDGVSAAEALLRNLASGHVLFPKQAVNRFEFAASVAKEIPIMGVAPRSLNLADLKDLARSMPDAPASPADTAAVA